MKLAHDSSFWGKNIAEHDTHTKALCGAMSKHQIANYDISMHLEAAHAHTSTRQYMDFQRCRNAMDDAEAIRMPGWTDGNMPQRPNRYTDGSRLSPINPDWAIAAWAEVVPTHVGPPDRDTPDATGSNIADYSVDNGGSPFTTCSERCPRHP